MTPTQRGFVTATAAYLLWGLFPLYFHLLVGTGAIEILANRILWSLVFYLIVLAFQRHWAWIWLRLREPRTLGLLVAGALFLGVNWGVYTWAVTHDHVVDGALGYFINPLITVVLGVVVLRERLRRAQWLAVGVAVIGVLVLIFGYGQVPWVAFVVSSTFAMYGFIKKQVGIPAIESTTAESAILIVPAVIVLISQSHTAGAFGHSDLKTTLLLIGAGPVTAVALLLFGTGAQLVPLTTMGLLQYITPILQFLCGVLILGESLPAMRLVGFLIVWIALAIFIVDSVLASRRGRAIEQLPSPSNDQIAQSF